MLHDRIGLARQIVVTGSRDVTSFIRQNPIVSGAVLGGSVLAGGLVAQTIRKGVRRRKARVTTRKRKVTRKRRVHRHKIRGRGLGHGEIKHSGRGTTGTRIVSFRNKKTGKMVRFKVKGTSKRRKGFVKHRVKRRSR